MSSPCFNFYPASSFFKILKVTNTTRFLASFRLLHKNHKTDNASVFPVDLCCFTFHSTGLDSTVTKFQSEADPENEFKDTTSKAFLSYKLDLQSRLFPLTIFLISSKSTFFNNLCLTADKDILRVGEEAQCHQICEKLRKRLLFSRGPGTGAIIIKDF